MKIDFKNQVLPHIVAILVFLVIVIIFFNPTLFGNKELSQHDVWQGRAGAKELRDYRASSGEEGLWTNSMFGGMPAYLITVVYNGDLLTHIQNAYSLFMKSPASIIFMALLSFYILLLAFGVRPYLAIAGAVIFGLSSHHLIGLGAGHNSRITAIAFMPLVLAGIQLAFSRKLIWGFVLTALGLALEIKANHLQITYYLLLIVLIYGAVQLYDASKKKTLAEFSKTIGLLVVAVIVAVGCNFGKLWTTYEYGKYSNRGKSELQAESADGQTGLERDYAFYYSNGITEPITLFVPNFMGGGMQEELSKSSHLAEALRKNGIPPAQVSQQIKAVPTYWGDQPNTAPYYAGAITLFLLILGIFFAEGKYKVWIIISSLLGIALSWGSSFETFNYLMFDYLPGYNKFRSVTFAIIMPILCMPILGFMGLEKFLSDNKTSQHQKKFFLTIGITAGFLLLLVLYSFGGGFRGAVDERLGNIPQWFLDAIRKDRASMLRSDAFRTLFLAGAFFAVLYLYIKEKVSSIVVFSSLIFLTALDMTLISKRYFNDDNFSRNGQRTFFTANEADQEIKKDQDISYRVFNLIDPFNDAKTSYHHKSVGGYHGAKIRRYQDVIEHCLQEERSGFIQSIQQNQPSTAGMSVTNMLNTKYFIFGESKDAIWRNTDANGNAWSVSSVKLVNSPDEELDALCSLDTKNTAVIDQNKFPLAQSDFGNGNIQLVEYKPNYLKYNASFDSDGLGVFSEIYYPKGWKAKLDGKEVDILRANYILRAILIPQGEHTIEFSFEPNAYYIGNTIMMIFNIILILMFLGAIVMSLKNNKPEASTNTDV
ncbi:YfhO family protein [Fulvivirgaceae bacterium BMA10]|uniref:YfhO family protein n=1 Tax=Splendidivirga corallicola TaxID=3051826 RepID=A0ABT8KRA6_9BACT|nr:YfhO family protein [Fulvivirgaceae bacterium BMA10]